MIVAQLYDYTQTQQIVHVKWVNCMTWELYHNKAVIFFQMREVEGIDLDGFIGDNFTEIGFELGFEVSKSQELVKCIWKNMNDM